MPTRVYLEVGKRRVFASAADWPGYALAISTLAAARVTGAGGALGQFSEQHSAFTVGTLARGFVCPAAKLAVDLLHIVQHDR